MSEQTELLVIVNNEGEPLTTFNIETFVSARRLTKRSMQIVLKQEDFPCKQLRDFIYEFDVSTHNKLLEKCLNWPQKNN